MPVESGDGSRCAGPCGSSLRLAAAGENETDRSQYEIIKFYACKS